MHDVINVGIHQQRTSINVVYGHWRHNINEIRINVIIDGVQTKYFGACRGVFTNLKSNLHQTILRGNMLQGFRAPDLHLLAKKWCSEDGHLAALCPIRPARESKNKLTPFQFQRCTPWWHLICSLFSFLLNYDYRYSTKWQKLICSNHWLLPKAIELTTWPLEKSNCNQFYKPHCVRTTPCNYALAFEK